MEHSMKIRTAIFILLLAIIIVTPAYSAPKYKIEAILQNDEYKYGPKKINDNGQVIAFVSTDRSTWHSVIWDKGKIIKIDTLGGKQSLAEDINNKGQVVGFSSISDGTRLESHAFLWENGNVTDLGTLKSNTKPDKSHGPSGKIPDMPSNSIAFAINNKGQIVGTSDYGGPYGDDLFLWENGEMNDLGGFSIMNNNGRPYIHTLRVCAITDSSKIITFSYIESRCKFYIIEWNPGNAKHKDIPKSVYGGFFEDRDCTVTELSDIPGTAVIGNVNNHAHITGSFVPDDQVGQKKPNRHAFIWQDGIFTDLGKNSSASGINDISQVVGRVQTEALSYAAIWENGKVTDLNKLIPKDSGWVLRGAVDINNKGQIIGAGIFNGKNQTFLLTPVKRSSQNHGKKL